MAEDRLKITTRTFLTVETNSSNLLRHYADPPNRLDGEISKTVHGLSNLVPIQEDLNIHDVHRFQVGDCGGQKVFGCFFTKEDL